VFEAGHEPLHQSEESVYQVLPRATPLFAHTSTDIASQRRGDLKIDFLSPN